MKNRVPTSINSVGVGMKKISGFCERCENFSPFLQRSDGTWLCTVCRDTLRGMDGELRPGFFTNCFKN